MTQKIVKVVYRAELLMPEDEYGDVEQIQQVGLLGLLELAGLGGVSALSTLESLVELTEEQAVQECARHGTDPQFFGLGEEEEEE